VADVTITGVTVPERLLAAALVAAALCLFGTPAAGATQEPDECGRLQVRGRLIVCETGAPFRWRGVTGFRLVHQLATGDEAGARRYLEWARMTGFNLVRVLSTAGVLFDLPPDAGLAALPAALDLARAHGLYVEVVAVVDSAVRRYDWTAHARAVAGRCAAAVNCVFEFANEPGHGTQHERLHDMIVVDREASQAVDGLSILWTAGPSWERDDAAEPSGAFVVRHLARDDGPWENVSGLHRLAALSERLGKPVVSNEPIGFDEVHGDVTGRQRTDACDVATAFGALGRVLEVPTTLHLQAGLQNDDPGRVQRRCAEDFIQATTVVPDEVVLAPRQADAPGSPVARMNRSKVAGLAVGAAGGNGLAVAFGVDGDPGIEWADGVSADAVIDRGAVRVWRLTLPSRVDGGSPWESNPPFPPGREADGFEDREGHRAPLASAWGCRQHRGRRRAESERTG